MYKLNNTGLLSNIGAEQIAQPTTPHVPLTQSMCSNHNAWCRGFPSVIVNKHRDLSKKKQSLLSSKLQRVPFSATWLFLSSQGFVKWHCLKIFSNLNLRWIARADLRLVTLNEWQALRLQLACSIWNAVFLLAAVAFPYLGFV